MPTVAENLNTWNGWYGWPGQGDEWSEDFGGTEALWWFVLYPRIHKFLPTHTILEIAPGRGRWTQFLKTLCTAMVGVDLSEKCIDHCKLRFASDKHIQFHVNDGTSLAVVPDESIDFVFSFDSLVHAEKETIKDYLAQLAKKLKPDGVGFIHHSNIGVYPRRLACLGYYARLPSLFQRYVLTQDHLETLLSINLKAWRATSMTAGLFREYCQRAGLKCVGQELINWGKGHCLIDGISIFARPGSRWDTKESHVENHDFVPNTAVTKHLAAIYCR